MKTLQGVWIFNPTISYAYDATVYIAFSSKGSDFTDMNMSVEADNSFVLEYDLNEVYNSYGWTDEAYRTVDFGETGKTYSDDDEFYVWLTTNAVPLSTGITYNGNYIGSVSGGQTATLTCAGNKAISDIVITFASDGSISYNGVITEVEAGKSATLTCIGKKMLTDVVVTVNAESEPETLATPTISLDGDILSITDESSLATGFAILVDGVEKTTVEVG